MTKNEDEYWEESLLLFWMGLQGIFLKLIMISTYTDWLVKNDPQYYAFLKDNRFLKNLEGILCLVMFPFVWVTWGVIFVPLLGLIGVGRIIRTLLK